MDDKVLADEYIGIRLHPDIRKLIEKRAREEGMTISEYVRYAVMLDCVFALNPSALKLLGSRFSSAFKLLLREKVEEYKEAKVRI
jgi:hypothetical protein